MKIQFFKGDGIKVGFNVLLSKGINAVRVEALARKPGVTKCGFYGYFLNRDALLQAMLDKWESSLTDETIDMVMGINGSLAEKLIRLFEVVDGETAIGMTVAKDVRLNYGDLCFDLPHNLLHKYDSQRTCGEDL